MTMRYVHPAAEEKRRAIHKFENFRAEAASTLRRPKEVTGSLQKSLQWSD